MVLITCSDAQGSLKGMREIKPVTSPIKGRVKKFTMIPTSQSVTATGKRVARPVKKYFFIKIDHRDFIGFSQDKKSIRTYLTEFSSREFSEIGSTSEEINFGYFFCLRLLLRGAFALPFARLVSG